MIQIVAIDQQHKKMPHITLDTIFSPDVAWFWVDMSQPTNEEINELSKTFKFHPLAIEDCIHKLQRPKLDYYGEYTFFVTHALNQLEKEEINFFVSKDYIVTFHHQDSKEINRAWNQLVSSSDISTWGSYYVFYQVVDKIVDNYFPVVYGIEDELDEIESNPSDKSMEELLEHLFDIRHDLLTLRHTINPMRDLLYRMLNSHHLQGIRERVEYFSDIYDHLLKLVEMVDSNREITMDIRDNYLSINSHQTNKVMQILTVITTIFMPLTFIVGLYGMNFEYMPELTWKYGYFVTLGVMAVIGVGMYIWFQRKGWFR
ncbi:magnesium/cobalt transporter CorA [Bacillus sp. HMF5848]|uniref:magnesium/cobalt transporter CorA n=1 Tax=Bacillus sp. HMF5848 TaxID=2495421 RepID=UPI000F7786FE|nr:magnesium/cobalt transporter CorA [Bacillus sp. HMF5848]RSK26022.1 magnesium/cobalt transporter CorA [Bacillus sp. HMF5848]